MSARSPLINVMANAATKAARALARDFGEVENLQVSRKGPADFVSAADLKAEKILRGELAHARPNFGFLMEESGAQAGADKDQRWIVDPLDGTTNFLHGIPHFAISIALEHFGKVVAGLVYQPINDEMYWAEKGRGAWLNGRRLRSSARRDLAQAVVATGIPHLGRGDHPEFLAILERIMPRVAGVRRFGAAALDLAYVASGRLDGFWETHLQIWDIAAGALIVREAGGYVSDFAGGSDFAHSGEIIAANDQLHGPLARLVSEGRQFAAKQAAKKSAAEKPDG